MKMVICLHEICGVWVSRSDGGERDQVSVFTVESDLRQISIARRHTNGQRNGTVS